MTRWAATLALMLSLVGCAHTTPVPVYAKAEAHICIDSAFTEAETVKVADAVYDWNRALQGVVTLWPQPVSLEDDIEECRVLVMRVTSKTDWVAIDSSTVLGYTDAIGGRWVWIVADRHPEWLTTVVAHELGHSFGLVHQPTGLMKPTINGHVGVSHREAVWAAYNFGMDESVTVEVKHEP